MSSEGKNIQVKHEGTENPQTQKDAGGKGPLTGAQVFADGGNKGATQYGKTGDVGQLPPAEHVLSTSKQSADAALDLKPEDKKNIKDIVDAVQKGNFDHRQGHNDSVQDIIKRYEHNPQRLTELKNSITEELQKRGLGSKYDVDIEPFDDRKNAHPKTPDQMNRRLFVISGKDDSHGMHAYTTDGKKASESLLKFIYD